MRKSLDVTSWERAEELKREIENGKNQSPALTLKQATDTFITDLEARNRAGDTIRKYKLLFGQLARFAPGGLSEVTFDTLIKFRAGWTEKGLATRNKKLDRLKVFSDSATTRVGSP